MTEKEHFRRELKKFAETLSKQITRDDEWTIRGFIDLCKNIYSLSPDTKLISKIIELHMFPHFVAFAESIGYKIEPATHQNWYPDMSFIKADNSSVKFAVDVKTTYRVPGAKECNGFTLGSHGEYFRNRNSTKNIQYPYNEYSGHFCLGIIYTKKEKHHEIELKQYKVDEIESIPSVIDHLVVFAEEKWKLASDKSGSGNTANIGSIKNIHDLVSGNGIFAKAGEKLFDEYWQNYGKTQISDEFGSSKALTSFRDFLRFRNLDPSLYNKPSREGGGDES